jgi:lipopolysaccharide biosynthesis glycosyltransferase
MTAPAVNVVVYFTRSYVVQATTMVRSLLDNAASGCHIDLYVLGVGLTADDIAGAEASWPADRLTVHWITVDVRPYARLFRSRHHPVAYARLLIDRLLPRDVTRVISLDSDGLVLDDIATLWQQAPAEACLSAAVDLSILRLGKDPSPFARDLRDHAGTAYFNTGAMVIDLARWRYLGLTSRCLHLARLHPGGAVQADQSLLNAVLLGDWERLPQRWNCNAMTLAECAFPSFRGRLISDDELSESVRRPGFVHFAGLRKPWKAASYDPHARLYREYQSRTQWGAPTATAGGRTREWYRRAMYPIDRYRRVQNQCRVHHLPQRRIGDIAHLVVTMATPREPWRELDASMVSVAAPARAGAAKLTAEAGQRPKRRIARRALARSAVAVDKVRGSRRGHEADLAEPIDAVYLWVDGSAPGTRARLSAALAQRSPDRRDEAADRRFRDHDELRYSLRSLERYAPWIRRVHVVTDGDPPPWLALGDHCAHVTHDQLFSESSCLPSFNSFAIELQLHRIPGLTRRFLYFNDDQFLGRAVAGNDYLHADGRQVLYLAEGSVPRNRDEGGVVMRAIAHTAALTEARWGAGAAVGLFSHTPQLLDCELLGTLESLWQAEHRRTSSATFRTPEDLVLGVLYPAAAAAGLGGLAPAVPHVLHYGSPDYAFVQLRPNPFDALADLAYVEHRRPRFFCVNDDLDSGALSDRLGVCLRQTLDRMYPMPSLYEMGA